MLANQLKKVSEQGNMNGSIMMLVQEYFGNCILRSSVDEVVSFMENYCIMVYKPYGSSVSYTHLTLPTKRIV